jgi:hypothetical protein
MNHDTAPKGFKAWFLQNNRKLENTDIFFGHWSTLSNIAQPHIYPMETLACGSGACATAAYLDKINKIDASEITVKLKGGDLFIDIDNYGVCMRGSAEFVFEGQIEI